MGLHDRPYWREMLAEVLTEKNRRQDPEIQDKTAAIQETVDYSDPKKYSTKDLEFYISTYQDYANKSDEEAIVVSWVRWVPYTPIPLERFITKYGKPDVSAFSDEDMAPYKSWKRGLLVNLTDDGKKVLTVEYSFTQEDKASAWYIKYPNSIYNPYIRKTKPKTQPSKKKK